MRCHKPGFAERLPSVVSASQGKPESQLKNPGAGNEAMLLSAIVGRLLSWFAKLDCSAKKQPF
jgi:hypothetical protein